MLEATDLGISEGLITSYALIVVRLSAALVVMPIFGAMAHRPRAPRRRQRSGARRLAGRLLSLALLLLALGLTFAAAASLLLEPGDGPSGRLFAADLRSSTVSEIDVARGRLVAQETVARNPHELVGHDGMLYATNYRSDRVTSLALDGSGAGAEIATPGRPHGIAVDGSGRIWVTSADGALHRLGPDGIDRSIAVGTTPHALTIDGQIAYVALAGDGAVAAFDLDRGVRLARAEVGPIAESIALSADGGLLAVPAAAADRVTLLRSMDLQQIWSVALPGQPVRVAFAGDRVLVSLARHGTLAILDVMDGALLASVAVGPLPDGVAVDASGRYAFVAAAGADYITVVDLANARAVAKLPAGDGPSGLLWQPSG